MKRGFWIWNLVNTEGGDALQIAAVASTAGLTDVFIKVADGPYRFNVDKTKGDLVPTTVAALRAVGIRVWGWQYIYGILPEAEEKIATQCIHAFGLDGFIVDAEVEFKAPGMGAKAITYLSRLKANNPGMTIAFSSFRFPHYHPEFPWAVFYQYCDINMPQDYWLQAHNAKEQTELCFQKFEAMGREPGSRQLPIYPAGPAWKENGWRPTVQERDDFEAVAAKHGAALVSYWDWEQCRRDLPELWPTKPAVPVSVSDSDRLTRIEKKVLDLEQVLNNLSQVVADLKAISKP